MTFSFIAVSGFSQWGNNNGRNNHDIFRNDRNDRDRINIYNYRTETEFLRALNLNRNEERRIDKINDKFQDRLRDMNRMRFRDQNARRFYIDRLEQERKEDVLKALSRKDAEVYDRWYSANRNNGRFNDYGRNNNRW